MGKFIKEFYYGNLDPQARSTKQNKMVQNQPEWVRRMNNIRQMATEMIYNCNTKMSEA